MIYLKAVGVCVFVFFSLQAGAQEITISGLVADSVSLHPLAGTSVKLKSSGKGLLTGENGEFKITAPTYDTLVITRTGYRTLEYPMIISESDVMILLREQVRVLKEVVVNFYEYDKIEHTKPREVKTLSVGEGIFSPFTYFSRAEKEKRILMRYLNEQNRVQVYVDLITHPRFRIEMMEQFGISEDQYYDLLEAFNISHQDVQYLKDEEEIRKRIVAFYERKLEEAQ